MIANYIRENVLNNLRNIRYRSYALDKEIIESFSTKLGGSILEDKLRANNLQFADGSVISDQDGLIYELSSRNFLI